jgi:trimethylamine:corrinoid methyltransferase-like protein
MLTDSQKDQLRDRVLDLLADVGIRVEHEGMQRDLLTMGCKLSPAGRVRFPRRVVDTFVASQCRTQAEDDERERFLLNFGIVDWGHFLFWTDNWQREAEALQRGVRTGVFDCGPTKYYDYRTGQAVPVDTDVFVQMKKWAQTAPEVGYISTWYRQDLPPQTERIESLVLALRYTDKVGGIEAIYPEVIKYLQAIGEIITGKPNESAYLAGSLCMTPPLIMDHRSAEEAVERARRKVRRYHVASMITIGMNTPVTLASPIVMMAAEILGGMICAYSQDPEAESTGRMLASVTDMRNAQVSYATAECTLVNVAVKELFDAHFGGHMRVDPFFIPSARRPGLQATYESFAGAMRLARLLGLPQIGYPGVGTLDNGGTGSPTQAVLDLEIRKAQFMPEEIELSDETLPWDEVCERIEKEQDFFTSDHTLAHFRELATSPVFRTGCSEATGWLGDEKAILDRCDEMWREQLRTWTPPASLSDDQYRALDGVVADARRELLSLQYEG